MAKKLWLSNFNYENDTDNYEELTASGKVTNMDQHRTGFVYDERLSRHYNIWYEDFTEKPERVTEPYVLCEKYELVDRCHRIPCREATLEEMLIKHSPEYIKHLQDSKHKTEEELKIMSAKYDFIYFHQHSYEDANLALGGTLDLVKAVLKDEVQNGLAMIRPPGHHALYQESCGYCHINNVAIAAQMALDTFGLERVLIVDWDVHHGQGTQYMFYDDPRVLYFSIHTYDYGNEWPFLRESDYDYVGEGAGTGYNINIPLNKSGCGNSEYMAIFQQILLPVAYEFSPELVIVSAGYDSAIGCPEGEMEVYPAMYSHFVSLLSALAGGKICLIQEGGYCVRTLAEGMAHSLKALLGDPCPLIGPLGKPDSSVVESILNAIKMLRPYWKSLCYQGDLNDLGLSKIPGLIELPPKPGIEFYTEKNRPESYDLYNPTYDPRYHDVEEELNARIDSIILNTKLTFAPHKLCLVYDEKMLLHRDLSDGFMAETPERISYCKDYLIRQGLWTLCLQVESRIATEEELALVHTQEYVKRMQNAVNLSDEALIKIQNTYNSVYICQETYLAAATAVGSLLTVVDTVMKGKVQAGVALIRPPGHHAEKSLAQGFCIFNNIGIAAKYAQIKYNVSRILIVDWDTHHGDAIQHLFYSDKSVLYISLHRYDHGHFYPHGRYGYTDRVGEKDGVGYNVNIAWNDDVKSDGDYIAAFQQVILPIAYQFDPELVFVGAGYDAAAGDLIGSYELSSTGYAHMTQMLKGLANGKLILALEGGYTLETTAQGLGACVSVLLGNPCPVLSSVTPRESAIKDIKRTIHFQKKHWSCLQYEVKLPTQDQIKAIKEQQSTDFAVVEQIGAIGGHDEDIDHDDQRQDHPEDTLDPEEERQYSSEDNQEDLNQLSN